MFSTDVKQTQVATIKKTAKLPKIADYLKKLPKVELHVHLDGTLEAELMFVMAQRNEVPFPYHSIEETRAAYKFNNLSEFLKLYFLGASVMRKEQDFYDLTYAYLMKAHQDGVCHSEMFVGPQTHTWKENVTLDMIMNGTIRAMRNAEKNFGITSNIIIDFNRSYVNDSAKIGKPDWSEQAAMDAPEDAKKTYHSIQKYLAKNPDNKKYIVGFGLDYAELGFPPVWFKELFKQIKGDGYKTVAHAGEEGPAEYVRQARADLLVDRIDHGNNAIHDLDVMRDIIENQIPLTMCPLSNKALCVVKDLKDHPLKKMLDQHVKVTINSDDPAYFGGYISQNYIAIADALNLNINELYQLGKNSIEATFLTQLEKNMLISKLDEYHFQMMQFSSQKNIKEIKLSNNSLFATTTFSSSNIISSNNIVNTSKQSVRDNTIRRDGFHPVGPGYGF